MHCTVWPALPHRLQRWMRFCTSQFRSWRSCFKVTLGPSSFLMSKWENCACTANLLWGQLPILLVYRPLVTALQVESAIVVPLLVRDRSLGELMLGSRKTEFFNNYDLQVISTAAGQLASAIEDATR